MCCKWLAENTGRKKSPKIRHLGTIAQLCWAVSLQTEARIDNRNKNLLNSNTSSTCPHHKANFSPLADEISSAALLHGTLVVGVSQTLWR